MKKRREIKNSWWLPLRKIFIDDLLHVFTNCLLSIPYSHRQPWNNMYICAVYAYANCKSVLEALRTSYRNENNAL